MCARMGDAKEFQKHVALQELCFERLKNAIPSELLSGCRQRHEEEGGNKEAVLEHIILNMTGSPVTAEDPGDAALQRTLRRTKRLLRRTNSVLFFRLVIMVLVAFMLMVTTFLTWNFTRTHSARSMKNLSFLLRHQILQSSANSLSFVLTQTYTVCLALNAMHMRAVLTQSNGTWSTIEKQLQSINWGFLQSEKQLSAVAFISHQDGHVTDFSREGNADYLFFVNESTAGGKAVWYSQRVTGSSNGYGLQPPLKRSVGPYQDSFMANVMAQHDVVWSLETGSPQNQIFSLAVPVKDPLTNQYLGTSVVTTKLGHLRQYLSAIDLMGGYLYFFWRNGSGVPSLIATSCDYPSNISVNPEKASNPFVAEAARYLESKYGGFSLLQNEAHCEDVILNGRKFYVDTLPLRNQFKFLNLTAVVIVPRTSMGEMHARSRTFIKVSVSVAVGMLVIGFLLICFLTRKMGTEMQLRQELIRQLVAKHKAEQSSNYKSQFLANMSHEMRTPMAGIMGLLDLLACDTLTPDQEVSVAHIRRCATGLLTLVNNVLDISKVEAGKMELESAPFNILDELESLVDMFAAQSLGSDLDFTLDLSDEIPHVLMGDAACIRQIFSNLLSNSLKFTAHGHILIRGWTDQSLLAISRDSMELSCHDTGEAVNKLGSCRCRSADSESQTERGKIVLVFEVDDTVLCTAGCGIPTSMQETVFDRFVQADSSTTRSHGGSGLGLYIVRSLVNMMGGDVRIASKPSPGTRIRFHVTVDRFSHPENVTQESSSAKARGSIYHDGLSDLLGFPGKSLEEIRIPSPEFLGRTHVLVALPETVTRNVTVHWLERRGIQVTGVNMWEGIIPTLNKLCKLSLADCNPFLSLRAQEMKGNSCIYTESPASPFALPSGGSSSCVSEITEWNRCPVLALIDLALMPRSLSRCQKSQKEGVASLNRSFLRRLDTEKIPSNLQTVLDALQQIQVKHDVLVAWVVAPNSGPCLKQALQSLPCSVVLKKPLHCSRMRRLLALYVDKLDQPHSDVLSYTSSDPSTPHLTRVTGPSKETHTTYNTSDSKNIHGSLKTIAGVHRQVCQELVNALEQDGSFNDTDQGGKSSDSSTPELTDMSTGPLKETNNICNTSDSKNIHSSLKPFAGEHRGVCQDLVNEVEQDGDPNDRDQGGKSFRAERRLQNSKQEHALSILPHIPTAEMSCQSHVQERLFLEHSSHSSVDSEESPSTPESPTSGLITPEGSYSTVDCIQEVRKDSSCDRRFENEWKGPIIDLRTSVKNSAKYVRSQYTDLTNAVVSASETSSTTEPHSPPGSHTVGGGGADMLVGMHILVVEDTPVLQRLASMMLKKLGAEVTVVGDGLQAVEAVAQAVNARERGAAAAVDTVLKPIPCTSFDLILMDCAMPVMDGYMATKTIREAEIDTDRHIPIVALTAHALASDEEKCLAVGMDAYLTKPINCKQLVSTVKRLVLGENHHL